MNYQPPHRHKKASCIGMNSYKTSGLHLGLFILCSFFLFMGCGTEVADRLNGTPNAFGKAGNVAVLADKWTWDGAPGDTMEYYYESAYPILPQPEPLFNLQHQTYENLLSDPIRRELRSYIVLANLSRPESQITKMVKKDMGDRLESGFGDRTYSLQVGKNKWAENQLVLYVIGKNESGLIDGIKASLPTFSKRLYDFDKIQYEANLFLGGGDVAIQNKIKEYYGIDMKIPDRYQIGVDKKPFLWIQDITPKFTSGLMFYSMPYKSQDAFSEDKLIALRDSLTRNNVSSSQQGSYMKINNVDLPTFYYPREIDGQYAAELRGIWDMKNEFMGGSFVSFLVHNPDRNEVIFIDGFVYAPGQKKREAMKQLIYLIEEIKL